MAEKKQENVNKKKRKKFERWFRFLHFCEKIVRVFYPYKRHYEQFLKGYNGPLIVVCNHYRLWDVIYPAMAIPSRPVHFMAKQELWDHKVTRWFCNKCQCIPVSRDGSGTDVKAMMQAIRYLKSGEIITIFPEGKRNTTGADMLPFKGGATALAIRTKTPIVPVVQIKKAKCFRMSHLIYGTPIEFTEYYDKKVSSEDIQACEVKLRDIMLKMRADYIAKRAEKKKK